MLTALNNLGASALLAHRDHSDAGLTEKTEAAATDTLVYARRAAAQAETLSDRYWLLAVTSNFREGLSLCGDIDTALATLNEISSIVNISNVHLAQFEHERARIQYVRPGDHAHGLMEDAPHDLLAGLGHGRFSDRLLKSLAATVPADVDVPDRDYIRQIDDPDHAVGDAVLCEPAVVLKYCLSDTDTAVRLGREEFGVVLTRDTVNVARTVCERVRSEIEATDQRKVVAGLRVVACRGVAPLISDSANRLERADGALCLANHGNRNRVCEASRA